MVALAAGLPLACRGMAETSAGPGTAAERSAAPDAARGLAPLGVALVNSVAHLTSGLVDAGLRPLDGSGPDRVVAAVISLFVDQRTLPAFALMLGCGAVMILRRQEAAGASWPRARGVLVRRWLWLGAFGVAHAVLLFFGDILLLYRLTGLVLVLFLRRSGRTLLVWAACLLLGSPLHVATILPAVLPGVWAARRRVLERPQDHLALLRRTAVVGLGVSVVGGAPFALVVGGLWEPSGWLVALAAGVHGATGVLGGAAFVALVALVMVAAGGPARTLAGRGVRAALSGSRAVGARSLTCYLAQSVLFVLPLAPWAGGLGVGMSTSVVALWAVGVWLVTLALAVWLRSTGRSGPAEALLRRLVYGRRTERSVVARSSVPEHAKTF